MAPKAVGVSERGWPAMQLIGTSHLQADYPGRHRRREQAHEDHARWGKAGFDKPKGEIPTDAELHDLQAYLKTFGPAE